MSQPKGSPAPSRLHTGATTTSSSTSRPNTNAATPLLPSLLPPILESHYNYPNAGVSSSLVSGSNHVGYSSELSRPSGVRKTTSQTNIRLGFYSSPDEPRSVGSYGYTSPSYTELRPAAPAARVATKPHGPTTAGLRPLRTGTGTSLLTEKDLEFLKERDAENQQVFEVWSQRKHLELQLEREELEKRKAEAEARYEAREQAILEANNTAVKQWEERKVKQQRAEAEDNYLKQIKLRALQVYRQRINQAYEVKCKKREEGFAVRSGAAWMPNSFDAFKKRPERGGAKPAADTPPGKETSSASYRSLLDSERELDSEAALAAMIAGSQPVVSLGARRATGELSPSAAAALAASISLEPSFASVVRHGTHHGGAGGVPTSLPPIVGSSSQGGLAQYIPPLQALRSEGGGLGAERSAAALRCEERAYSQAGEGEDDEEVAEPQAILPPNITSVYAPREVIGAIVAEAEVEAGGEAEAGEGVDDGGPGAARPQERAEKAAMEEDVGQEEEEEEGDVPHLSPAFLAAYGSSSTGSGAGSSARGRPASGRVGSSTAGGSAPHENGGYSRSGSELWTPRSVAISSVASFGRREPGSHIGSAAGSVSPLSGGDALLSERQPVRRESLADRIASSSGSKAESYSEEVSGPLSRRESRSSRGTSSSSLAVPYVADIEDQQPSRRESRSRRIPSAASSSSAAPGGGGSADLGGGAANSAASAGPPQPITKRRGSRGSRAASVAAASFSSSSPASVEGAASSEVASESRSSRHKSRSNRTASASASREPPPTDGAITANAAPSSRQLSRGKSRLSRASSDVSSSTAVTPRHTDAGSEEPEQPQVQSQVQSRSQSKPPSHRGSASSGVSSVYSASQSPRDATGSGRSSASSSRPGSAASRGTSASRRPPPLPLPVVLEGASEGRLGSSGSSSSAVDDHDDKEEEPEGESSTGATSEGRVVASTSAHLSMSPVGLEASLASLVAAPLTADGAAARSTNEGSGSSGSEAEEDSEEEEEDEEEGSSEEESEDGSEEGSEEDEEESETEESETEEEASETGDEVGKDDDDDDDGLGEEVELPEWGDDAAVSAASSRKNDLEVGGL